MHTDSSSGTARLSARIAGDASTVVLALVLLLGFGNHNGGGRKMISAYLDPASGSAIIGAVAAGGAGIAVAGRAVLSKLGFGKNKSSNETPSYEETNDSEGVGETDEITQ